MTLKATPTSTIQVRTKEYIDTLADNTNSMPERLNASTQARLLINEMVRRAKMQGD
jgi:hypothetical protein